MNDQRVRERVWGEVELCGEHQGIEIAGQKLVPDSTKAYLELRFLYGWTKGAQVVTAYGTAIHPGTVANSYASLQHQVFNLGHMMRSYDKSKDRDEIRRDYILGTVVGVDYPRPPAGGWRVDVPDSPCVRAVAVLHKKAEKVPQVLGEHLGGRHKWTVSAEVDFSLLQSGFIVGNRSNARSSVEKILAETTPGEFNGVDCGYVPLEQAPEELLECYSLEKRRITKGTWEGHPVVLLKGGVNGKVHLMGAGMVRYGAERTAEIQQILATDPDRLTWVEEDHGVQTTDHGPRTTDVEELKGYFGQVAKLGEELLRA
jgi:hypothetical protein